MFYFNTVVRFRFVFIILILAGLPACKINTQIEGSKTNESGPNQELKQPTLQSPTVSDGSNLDNFLFAGICPKNASSIEITVSNTNQSLSCFSGNFNGNLNLLGLAEGHYQVTLSPDVGIAKVVTLIVDLTDPSPPSALVVPSWYGSISRTPSLTWTGGFDDISGISHYEVQLIKNSDSSIIRNWTPIPNGGYLSGLSLTHAQTYHFSIRAVDRSGRSSTEVVSSSFRPDVVGPTISGINWTEVATLTDSPQFSWGGSDNPSGVSHYEISLGSLAGAQDIMTWTTLNPVQSPIVSPKYPGVYSNGVAYYFNVRGVDNAGNVGDILSISWALPQTLLFAANFFDRGPFTSTNVKLATETISSHVYDANTDKHYIGGYFLSAGGGQSSNKLARLNSDGTYDSSFNIGSGFNGPVYKTLTQADGKVIVGGEFTQLNGTSANNIIRLNADGSLDSSFNTGTGLNGSVMALALDPVSGNKIYVGGSFNNFNEVFAGAILRLNPDGSLDSSFNTGTGLTNLMSGFEFPSQVNAFYVYADGRLLVGGRFNAYNGTTNVGMLIRLASDGALDASFPTLVGKTFPSNDEVLYIKPYNSTWLLVGGKNIGNYGGQTNLRTLLRIRMDDGSKDAGFDIGATATSYAATANSAGKIFNLVDTLWSGIFRRNANGSKDFTWPDYSIEGPNSMAFVRGDIVIQADDKIVVGGHFSYLNNNSNMTAQSHGRIVRLNTNGSFDGTFNTKAGFDGIVYTLELQTDNKFIVGGDFSFYGGERILNLARLNSDFTIDTSFAGIEVGYGFDISSIQALGLQSNGKLILGGEFTKLNNSVPSKLARLNPDATVDTSFTKPINGDIAAVVVQSDDKVLIGGTFTTYDGTTTGAAARLSADGNLDTTFNSGGSGFNNAVSKIIKQSDNKLLIGGTFTTYNGQPVDKLVRLNVDGTLDTSFTPAIVDGLPLLYLDSVNKILVSSAGNLYRLNNNGELDSTFNSPTLTSTIVSIAALSNGRYIVGTNSGASGKALHRINADGSEDHSFFVPLKNQGNTPPNVTVIIPLSTTHYAIGGYFKFFGSSTFVNNFITTNEP